MEEEEAACNDLYLAFGGRVGSPLVKKVGYG